MIKKILQNLCFCNKNRNFLHYFIKNFKYDTSVCHLVRRETKGLCVRLCGVGKDGLWKLGACKKGFLEYIFREMASGRRG